MGAAKAGLAMVVCSSALAACNAVVGIDDPIEIRGPDAAQAFDAPRAPSGGDASTRDAPPETAATEAGPAIDALRVDVMGPPAPSPLDGGSGSTLDGPGGNRDATEGGATVLGPGVAIGTCNWSEPNGTNADVTTLISNLGSATRTSGDAGEITEVTLTSFVRGISRSVIIRLPGSITSPTTFTLDDVIRVEYYEVATSRRWSSALAKPRGGSVRIDALNGTTFAFTLTAVKMGPDNSQGSFTLNGSGSANAR